MRLAMKRQYNATEVTVLYYEIFLSVLEIL